MNLELHSDLLRAVGRDDQSEIRRLAAMGNNLNMGRSRYLRLACQKGSIEAVRTLLGLGALPVLPYEDHRCTGRNAALLSPLATAAAHGHIDCINALLRGKQRQISGAGLDALVAAAVSGQAAAFKLLLRKGASLGAHTQRVFAEAIYAGHLIIAIEMIALGARVNDVMHNPLLAACRGGHTEIVRHLLLTGADVHFDDDVALRVTVGEAKKNATQIAEVLLRGGADVRAGGGTLVQTAVANGDISLVRLLAVHGADVNATRDGGERALCTALRQRQFKMVWFLLSVGADPDLSELPALIGASDYDSDDRQLQLLLLAGLDPQAVFDRSRDLTQFDHGLSARFIDSLIDAGVEPTVKDVSRLIGIVCSERRFVLEQRQWRARMDDESGCDEPSDDEWPEVDENGNFISPQPQAIPELSVERLNEGLVAAAALDLPAVVELLVRFGARSLYEAFMLAVDEDCPGAVRALITAGADPLANDFRAIRIADKRLCWLESLAGMTDDRSSLLVQTLLECSRHRSPDFRAQYSARQAVEVAMADEANRDPKALIALHQHGLVAIRSEILRYEEENVIPRYFGNNRFAQRRQALFSRAYQDPLVDRNIGLDLGFDSLDDDIPF